MSLLDYQSIFNIACRLDKIHLAIWCCNNKSTLVSDTPMCGIMYYRLSYYYTSLCIQPVRYHASAGRYYGRSGDIRYIISGEQYVPGMCSSMLPDRCRYQLQYTNRYVRRSSADPFLESSPAYTCYLNPSLILVGPYVHYVQASDRGSIMQAINCGSGIKFDIYGGACCSMRYLCDNGLLSLVLSG